MELKLIANTIKHAEGPSAGKLYKIRPDLFSNPILQDESRMMTKRWVVSKPLFGEDLYITLDDFTLFVEAVKGFWSEFAEIIEAHYPDF